MTINPYPEDSSITAWAANYGKSQEKNNSSLSETPTTTTTVTKVVSSVLNQPTPAAAVPSTLEDPKKCLVLSTFVQPKIRHYLKRNYRASLQRPPLRFRTRHRFS